MHPIDEMLMLSLEGENDKAWKICEKLEKQGPKKILDTKGQNTEDIWFRHCFNRGWHLIQNGNYNEGSRLLDYGRYLNTYGGLPLRTSKPIFNPSENKSEGKSIILCLEGGYGDEIIHARFVKHLKSIYKFQKVYLCCVPELGSLFSRIEGVDGIINRNEVDTVEHDYWIPGFSAGWICGFEHETLPGEPYLTSNFESSEMWKQVIKSDKPKVGIRWAGNPQFEHQQFRIFNAQWLIKMAEAFPDVQFYSLQKDNNLEKLPDNVVDLSNILISWEDTAAAISNMDLVISSCTSVAHLAAALGKETWVITPILPYHTWAYGAPGKPGDRGSKTSPWYDTIKVYRQLYKEVWKPTFDEIYDDFELKFNTKRVIEIPSYEKVSKSINLGCGFNKLNGYLNVDCSELCQPDEIVNLEQFPWPYKDNEFSHIVAKDILEHLRGDFCQYIKELYRISDNGAVWEIQFPHPRSDHAFDDPTHVRFLSEKTFKLFDRMEVKRLVESKHSESYLAFEHDVDINVVETKYDFNEYWINKVKDGEMTDAELFEQLNFQSNVAASIILLIQVHKPPRVTNQEFMDLVNKK
ncbi:hypothetical protein UFOVP250_3 [uncultured Caudovirales phage]|uniref:Methyltransferase type 11 domain-containing protein n=1 Tax=uncultured Caudovirales phage TaxID=2100421 RepID=A0A6J5LIH0_9CAUD|nr:hypothetical protein UFOVP250_3 [uncultured Caudovirales phage]